MKETIEILFGEGLLKCLFATETFAMGLNMPARTVLFTGGQKFDGKDFRLISSGEYIQVSYFLSHMFCCIIILRFDKD